MQFFFYLMKRTSMDFFRLFGFWQESHWTLYFFFLKTIYLYIIYHYCIAANFPCCFLEEFHSVLLLATIWRPNLWVLRKIWLSECLPFENYCFHKNILYLEDVLLTCNIWKHLCWTHFYNLVASFRRVQRQKTFIILLA